MAVTFFAGPERDARIADQKESRYREQTAYGQDKIDHPCLTSHMEVIYDRQ
jgi:hypothetical protein